NALVWEYGLLDGQIIDWTQKAWRGWIDLGAWIVAIGAAMVFYRTIERPVIYLAFAIFSLQLIHLTFTGVQNADALWAKSHVRHSASALQEILRFDSKRNVLHIVLDGFQSDVFAEIVNAQTDSKRYRSAMQGFVFYEENMGVFPSTYMSVPAFLSAKIYHNHMPKEDYVNATISGKTILNSVFQAGYEIDIVSEQHMVGVYTKGRYSNAYIIPNGHSYHASEKGYELDDAAKLLDLTLFRLAPHFIKKHVHNNQLWTVQPLINGARHLQLWHFAHSAFLRNLADNMSAGRGAPTYKLLHLMNTHWPMVVDDNCNYPGHSLPHNRKATKAQSKCSLDAVIDVFERMKALGIYDDALVILMADHGAGARITLNGPDGQSSGVSDDTTVSPISAKIVSMALPLMAIKLPGATGPMQTSAAPSSLLDTAATVNAILGLGDVFAGRSILELRPGERRLRGYYYHEWRRDDWETDYFGPIQEYIVDGSVYDRTAWNWGTRFLPPTEQAKTETNRADTTLTP
ncbi:MAG: sulfatase-like hydrolase/transferase, partial [Acidiferrobacterales bacterium]